MRAKVISRNSSAEAHEVVDVIAYDKPEAGGEGPQERLLWAAGDILDPADE